MKFPLFALALGCSWSLFAAETPKALPEGEVPEDARLGPLKELDGYFPFTPPVSREAWEKRAEDLRMQLRVALGLWPAPTKTPLNAVVHGKIEQADYTVEKVYFESMPGFFVTGSLFRPKTPGTHPAVLCPHGHWNEARFAQRSDAEMKKELESGGEVLAEGGRNMFQALGVQLARMGIVAFVVDMIGYCDATQLSFDLAHKFAKQRPEMNTAENWGLFSPQAEAHAQSIMGLQTWNNIRALDFLTSLPDVDAKRLGCTGASGGGTQTMLLAALDPRLAVACPAVMVSTAMQGGCTCENASLLRIGTGNVEIAGLFAPKPMGMTAANDWTKEMKTKGFPELQKLYEMLGKPGNVALWPLLKYGHNYNAPSRQHIYEWFNDYFFLNLPDERLVEREYPLLSKEQLTVWDEQHPAPAGGDDFERRLLKWWHDDAQAQLARSPEPAAGLSEPAWRALINWRWENAPTLTNTREVRVSGGGKTYQSVVWTLQAGDGRFALPAIDIEPPESGPLRMVLYLTEQGKAGLFDAEGKVRPDVCRLLNAGFNVVGLDLIGTGEYQMEGETIQQTRRTKNPREAAAYTFGYNSALFAQRVHDVCTTLWHLNLGEDARQRYVVATDGTGPIAAAALAVLGDDIEGAVIRPGSFRFGQVLDLQSPNFLPAAAKYGDISGALDLAKRHTARLLILGEGEKVNLTDWLTEK